ncbi:MAG: hypothetical protein JWO41_60 [Candidatus Saccharibacteria bacterium]|nr:hypothetical protein [Candidatus Saccharibacteria bacterium]
MSDPLTKLYSSFLHGTAKMLLSMLVVGAVIVAGVAGFAIDFGRCFGNPDCSGGSGLFMFIFPTSVAAIAIFIYHKLRQSKQNRQKDAIRQEVMTEMNMQDRSAADTVFGLINDSGEITFAELLKQTGINQEQANEIIRQLINDQAISQHIVDGRAVYSAHN